MPLGWITTVVVAAIDEAPGCDPGRSGCGSRRSPQFAGLAQWQRRPFVRVRSPVRIEAAGTIFDPDRPGRARVALTHVEQSSILWSGAIWRITPAGQWAFEAHEQRAALWSASRSARSPRGLGIRLSSGRHGIVTHTGHQYAGVAEREDAAALKSVAEWRAGSRPVARTKMREWRNGRRAGLRNRCPWT